MTTTLPDVREFLRNLKPARYDLASWSCMALVMRWHKHVTGRALVTKLHRDGITLRDIWDVARMSGGIEVAAESSLIANGWTHADAPEPGCIVTGRHEPACFGFYIGLWSGGRCVSVAPDGLLQLTRPETINEMQSWELSQQ